MTVWFLNQSVTYETMVRTIKTVSTFENMPLCNYGCAKQLERELHNIYARKYTIL